MTLRSRLLLLLVLVLPLTALGQGQFYSHYTAWCENGGVKAVTQGLTSVTHVQASYPSCTVTVYNHASSPLTLATLYTDQGITPLSNPFTATTSGWISFYVVSGEYDVVKSGGGLLAPVTTSDLFVTGPGGPLGTKQVAAGPAVFFGAINTLEAAVFPGSDPCRRIAAAAQQLVTSPTACGTVDARSLSTAQLAVACASTLTLPACVGLKLPSGTLTLNGTPGLVLNSNQILEGNGTGASTIDCEGTGACIDGNGGLNQSVHDFSITSSSTAANLILLKSWGSYPRYFYNLRLQGAGNGTTGCGPSTQMMFDLTGDPSGGGADSGSAYYSNILGNSWCGEFVHADHTQQPEFYNVTFAGQKDNTSSVCFHLDTGAAGVALTDIDCENSGKHALWLSNSGSGTGPGSDGSPVFTTSHNFEADFATGGEGIYFDPNLHNDPLRSTFMAMWAAAAGLNHSNTPITAHAAGIGIDGGSNFQIQVQQVRSNGGSGVRIGWPAMSVSGSPTCTGTYNGTQPLCSMAGNIQIYGGEIQGNNVENDTSALYESAVNAYSDIGGLNLHDFLGSNIPDSNGHQFYGFTAQNASGSYTGMTARNIETANDLCSASSPAGTCANPATPQSFLFLGSGQKPFVVNVADRTTLSTQIDFPYLVSFGLQTNQFGLNGSGSPAWIPGPAFFSETYQITGPTIGQVCFNVPTGGGSSQCAVKVTPSGVLGANLGAKVIGQTITDTFQVTSQLSGCAQFDGSGNLTSTGSNCGSGGGGGVSSITATAPVVATPSPITTTGVLSCPTCTVASSPATGIGHFAGATQTLTSSPVGLASADVSGILPIASGGNGTASPGIVAGTNVTISGSWPTQTINASSSTGVTSIQMQNGGVPFGSPLTGVGSFNFVGSCVVSGTSPNFTITCSGGGGGGSVNPAPQYSLGVYVNPGTASQIGGAFASVDSTFNSVMAPGNFVAGNAVTGPYVLVNGSDPSVTTFASPGVLSGLKLWGNATTFTGGAGTGNAGLSYESDGSLHWTESATDWGPTTLIGLSTCAGTATITCTAGWSTLSLVAYAPGLYQFTPANTVTGTSATMNIDSIGAANIKLYGGGSLVASQSIVAGHPVLMLYTGSQFEIVQSGGSGSANAGYTWQNSLVLGGGPHTVNCSDFSSATNEGKWFTITNAATTFVLPSATGCSGSFVPNGSCIRISNNGAASATVTINPSSVTYNGPTVLQKQAGGVEICAALSNTYNAFGIGSARSGLTFTSDSGCSETSPTGGATAGQVNSGTTGTCTFTVTMGDSATATNAWACAVHDITTPANFIGQQAPASSPTTKVKFTGTTVSGDVLAFACTPY